MLHPPNPNTHPDWLAPHSLAWYTQLGEMTGEYVYPWRSTITEPNGESLFMEEIDDTFDCAYNRKGPTSAYPDIARVVKRGGSFIGLHPGDQLSAELFEWLPHLFGSRPADTPILQNLQKRLRQAAFQRVDIQTVIATEYPLFSRPSSNNTWGVLCRFLTTMRLLTVCPLRICITSFARLFDSSY